MSTNYRLSSESVTEGHPDKVADFIADSLLDAYLAEDPTARVAIEVLVKDAHCIVAGEVTTVAHIDISSVVRTAIGEIGYTDPTGAFHADGVNLTTLLSRQAPEIAAGVTHATDDPEQQGAGDQGMMYGYATAETEVLLPLPIYLAHQITRQLAQDRKGGHAPFLRPDAKAQVTVAYDGQHRPVAVTDVLISTQHTPSVSQAQLAAYVREELLPRALGQWLAPELNVLVNPSGSFVEGGPSADCGVTGRKIIVDTYGGIGRHGGGAFSGKDPSKVDRSGAYFARLAARTVVLAGLARRAEVQVAYAIGHAQPVSVHVETFGTGDGEVASAFLRQHFDFRPGAIVERLELRRPIYRQTTNYGHFGKPGIPWELPLEGF